MPKIARVIATTALSVAGVTALVACPSVAHAADLSADQQPPTWTKPVRVVIHNDSPGDMVVWSGNSRPYNGESTLLRAGSEYVLDNQSSFSEIRLQMSTLPDPKCVYLGAENWLVGTPQLWVEYNNDKCSVEFDENQGGTFDRWGAKFFMKRENDRDGKKQFTVSFSEQFKANVGSPDA